MEQTLALLAAFGVMVVLYARTGNFLIGYLGAWSVMAAYGAARRW